MKKITLLLLCFWLISFHSWNEAYSANNKISSYSQLMLYKYQKDAHLKGAKSKEARIFTQHDGTAYVSTFILYDDISAIEDLQEKGVLIETILDGILTCRIPINRIEEIAGIESVMGIEFSQPVYSRLDSVRRCSNITPIHQGSAPLTKSYKGSGVIVGVVDEGFDFTHPNYYDATGTTYRVSKVWVQDSETSTTPPSGYSYGNEYTSKSAILAIKTDDDNETHGTHTSGIAAGGGYGTAYTGIAPESDIVLVATDMTSMGIVNGVQYIMAQAASAGKPCVVNLSLGSDVGPHDGTSVTDMAFDKLIKAGNIVVGAAGNSGSTAIHIQKQFAGTDIDSVLTILSPSATNTTEMIADIWGRNNQTFNVQLMIYNTQSNAITARSAIYPVNNPSINFTLNTVNASYDCTFANQLYSGNGCYNMIVAVENDNTFNDTENVVIKVTSSNNVVVNMWATDGTFISNGLNDYTAGDTDFTVGEVGGVGKGIISVGAYTTKPRWYALSIPSTPVGYNPSPTLYSIASFSSKGPTADNRIKPDITAPGFGVVSGYNSYNLDYGYSNQQTVASRTFNGKTYYWGVDQGTSMACPVVTGIIALWLQAYPKLTADQIRTIFQNHAFDPTLQRAPLTQNNVYGWGKIDGLTGMVEAVALDLTPQENIENVCYIYPNPSQGLFVVKTKASFNRIRLSDLSGQCIFEDNFSEKRNEYELQLDKNIPGVYLVSIHSDKGIITSKVIIY